MSSSISSVNSGAADLARHAVMDSELQDVNKDFETLLVREVVKSMRKTLPKGGILSSESGQGMQDYLIENALSECLAQGEGLGIGKLLSQSPLDSSEK